MLRRCVKAQLEGAKTALTMRTSYELNICQDPIRRIAILGHPARATKHLRNRQLIGRLEVLYSWWRADIIYVLRGAYGPLRLDSALLMGRLYGERGLYLFVRITCNVPLRQRSPRTGVWKFRHSIRLLGRAVDGVLQRVEIAKMI